MVEALRDLSPVVQVLLATGFTWGMTMLGAALVFLTRRSSAGCWTLCSVSRPG